MIGELQGEYRLMAGLRYGAGLRFMECLRQRVQDVDFEANQITARAAAPGRQRAAAGASETGPGHARARPAGRMGRASLPEALARRYPNAAADWRWQYVFPAAHRWVNHQTGERGRITSMRPLSSVPARTPSARSGSPSTPPATRSATHLPHTCLKTAMTFEPSQPGLTRGLRRNPIRSPRTRLRRGESPIS